MSRVRDVRPSVRVVAHDSHSQHQREYQRKAHQQHYGFHGSDQKSSLPVTAVTHNPTSQKQLPWVTSKISVSFLPRPHSSVPGSLRPALPCFRPRFAPLGSALLPPSVRSARLCLRFRPGFAPLGSAFASAPLRPFARRLLTHFHTRSLAHARTQNNYMHNNLTTDLLLSPFPLTTVIPQPFPFNLSIFPLPSAAFPRRKLSTFHLGTEQKCKHHFQMGTGQIWKESFQICPVPQCKLHYISVLSHCRDTPAASAISVRVSPAFSIVSAAFFKRALSCFNSSAGSKWGRGKFGKKTSKFAPSPNANTAALHQRP